MENQNPQNPEQAEAGQDQLERLNRLSDGQFTVKRSNGNLETGWNVVNMAADKDNQLIVELDQPEQRMTKWVRASDLLSWQPQMTDEATIETVPRSQLQARIAGEAVVSPEGQEADQADPVTQEMADEAIEASGVNRPQSRLQERLGLVAKASEQPGPVEAQTKPPEKLGLNNFELDLIGRLVHEINNQAYREVDSLDMNQTAMATYQGVMDGIHRGEGEKQTAATLATLVAAGAVEDLPMSSHLLDTACQEVAKLVNPEEAGNLAYQLRQAIAYKDRDDISRQDLAQEMYHRFSTMAGDSYLNDKPKVRAAVLAFAAGMTARDPQLSHAMMTNLASLHQAES
ncbi:MAG TPA: hypothetical protein VFG56_00815 [Candidatus Saccharimonadales bacterium]|nr:hypothetical protein [Candidatus Saccharimonadales bacterium]